MTNNPFFGKQHNDKTKEKISKSLTGTTKSEECKKKIAEKFKKPINQFTLEKIFLKTWISVSDVKLKLGIFNLEINSNKFFEGDLYWELGEYNSINQYIIMKKLIKKWDSIIDAGNSLNIPYQNISACCRKERKTAKNFYWEYATQEKD